MADERDPQDFCMKCQIDIWNQAGSRLINCCLNCIQGFGMSQGIPVAGLQCDNYLEHENNENVEVHEGFLCPKCFENYCGVVWPNGDGDDDDDDGDGDDDDMM